MSFENEYYELKKKRKKKEEEEEEISPSVSIADIIKNEGSKEWSPQTHDPREVSRFGQVANSIEETVKNSAKKREEAEKEKEKNKGLFDDLFAPLKDGWDQGDVASIILDGADRLVNNDATSWLGTTAMTGLASFNKGITATADFLLGRPMQALGWENNPISSAADYYSDQYNIWAKNRAEAEEKLAGGKVLKYAGDVIEGAGAALPDAIMAFMTMGASALPSATKLATQAAYQAGNLLSKAGLTTTQMAKNPQFWLSFSRTLGADFEDAKANGADDTTAAWTSVLTALINSGIEIGFDGGSGIQGLLDDVANGGKNKLLAWVESSLEEGGEEVLQGFVNNAVAKVTYDEDREVLNPKEMLKEFGLGVGVGGLMGAGQTIVQTTVNSVESNQLQKLENEAKNALAENEQKVVDRVYQDEIAKAEEEKGKKLTKSEKEKLYNDILDDMAKGYISTDTIESVLGGEDYESYKQALDEETKLTEELEALESEYKALNEKETKTLAEEARISELKQAYQDIKAQVDDKNRIGKRDYLKAQLNKNVYEMTKNDRLRESYFERVRADKDFAVDLNQYEGRARDVMQQVMDSKLVDDTNKSHEFWNAMANIAKDRDISIAAVNDQQMIENVRKEYEANGKKFDESKFHGKRIDGYRAANGDIYINVKSDRALNFIAGHEITHALEKSGHYNNLQQILFDYKKGEYEARYAERAGQYAGIYTEENYKDLIDKEVTADLVGDFLFTDKDFVTHLSTENRTVFQKIWDEVKYLAKVVTAGSKEARQLAKVQKVFEEVYREAGKAQGGKYSVSETTDGRYVAVVDNDILSTIDTSKWDKETKNAAKKAASKELKKFSNGFVINGIEYVGNKASRGEYTRSDYSEALARKNPTAYLDKMRAASVLDDVIRVATDWTNDGKLKYDRDDYVDFVRGKTLIMSGDRAYSAIVLAGITEDGKAVFHDVEDVYPDFFEIKKSESSTTVSASESPNSILEDSVAPNVTQDGENVKYSLSDSDGKQLTKGQQEYFKDAKMRDEDGNLMAMYSVSEAQNQKGLNRGQEVAYSISNDTKYADAAIELNQKTKLVSDEVMEAQKTMRERIASRLLRMKGNGVALPDDIEGRTDIANSSYDVTEENTTICPRSLSAEAFVDAVSEMIGRPLTVDEQIYISQDLQGRSLTPECTYCYVATDRKAYRAFLGEYINQRDAVIEKLRSEPNADTSRSGALYKEFLNGRKDTDPMYKRFSMWVDAYKKGAPMITASHLANISKLMGDINSEFGADLKPQIADAMKYAQSASWAKKRINYVAYNGHILKWKQDRINKLNSHYGLRMYSFSDFHPAFVLENMQMITDAAARGLKVLGYTKDTDFVEIFAPSGMNINVSTFGFESGGNVYENNIIGAEWQKAKDLREQYPNVGITFVATNDTITEWALAQDWIDVVIPYHLVRTGAEVANAFKFTNYTGESSDTKTKDWVKGDKKYIAPTEHNNDKATYLAALEKNHLKPRFERFIDNPNYMKLVNECRQSASDSKPVQPIFNEDAANLALNKLEANGYYQPIGGSVDRMYEIAAEVAERMPGALQNANRAPGWVKEIAPSMSISEDGKAYKEYGRWNVKGIQYDGDIGPAIEEVTEQTVPTTDEFAPAADQEATVQKPVQGATPKTFQKGKERKWVGTSTGSEAVGGAVKPEDIPDELRYYQPIPNKKTLGNANAKLDRMGYDTSLEYFSSQLESKKVTLDDIALGERLIQEAIKKGDTKTASELIQNVAILGTELGQKVQALSIIKKLTPEGQLMMLQKTVDRGKAKGDKAFEGVELTQDMKDQILSTYKEDGSFDQKQLTSAVENVKQQIADQMQVTAWDKVNAWRYLSMLGNPKTHIRNLVSNVAMYGTRQVKNAIARTIEDIAPIKDRTKTWKKASIDVKLFAQQALQEYEAGLNSSKYNEASSIKEKRQIFKTNALEWVSNKNSDALTAEDALFSKPAYKSALIEFLTANGIATESDIKKNPQLIEKAKQYAQNQAKEATFQQDSYLANKISEIESRNALYGIGVGSILPFKKTPINIARAGISYSPLGIARNIYDMAKVKKGEMDASEAIDHVAQTITGTSLTLVGFMLAQAGVLNGAGDDDKEGQYDYQLGKQSYSFNFNGSTFSLNWLSPVAMPLFVGANAYEQLVEGKEWNADVVVETLAQTLDPLSEMSFLSSLDSVLSSYDSGIQKFMGIFETAAQNYVTQFIPTLSSQIAATFDDTKRSTKVAADSNFKFGDQLLNQIAYKIPGLRNALEPATDIWGKEIKQTENGVLRAAENFLAPWSKKNGIASDVDEEIKDLYRQIGDSSVIPAIPGNTINYDDVKYEMTAKEYTRYKEMYGQTARNTLEALFETSTYQNADSETRRDMVKAVYDYARDEARLSFFDGRGVEFTNATEDGEEVYKENAIKGAIAADLPVAEYKFSQEYPEKYSFFKKNNLYDTYAAADEEGKRAYNWAYDNPGKYTMGEVVTGDFLTFYQYRGELLNLEADTDDYGNTVSGSKKDKVIDYLNATDLDYGQKVILFRSLYSSQKDRDTYNRDIIDYLESREDISYAEMKVILEELGFTVNGNRITWD